MSESIRCSSIGEQNHDLVLRFWCISPKVKSGIRVLNSSLRVTLLGVNEIRKLDRIFDEKYRCVISYHVIVTFLGIKLDGKTARVTIAVVSTTLSGYS